MRSNRRFRQQIYSGVAKLNGSLPQILTQYRSTLPRVVPIWQQQHAYAENAMHESAQALSFSKAGLRFWTLSISIISNHRQKYCNHVLKDTSRLQYFWCQEGDRTFHSSAPIAVRMSIEVRKEDSDSSSFVHTSMC